MLSNNPLDFMPGTIEEDQATVTSPSIKSPASPPPDENEDLFDASKDSNLILAYSEDVEEPRSLPHSEQAEPDEPPEPDNPRSSNEAANAKPEHVSELVDIVSDVASLESHARLSAPVSGRNSNFEARPSKGVSESGNTQRTSFFGALAVLPSLRPSFPFVKVDTRETDEKVDKRQSMRMDSRFTTDSQETGYNRRLSRKSFLIAADANAPIMQKLEAAGFRTSVASEAILSLEGRRGCLQTILYRVKLARLKLWLFLEEPWYTLKASCASSLMVIIICASVLHSVLVQGPDAEGEITSGIANEKWLGTTFNCIFCADLLIRFWAFPQRCAFLNAPKNMVDLLSVMPFMLNKVFGLSERFDALDFMHWINAYEAFLRLVKLSRYFWGWQLLFRAVTDSVKALVVPLYFLLIMVFFGSCTLYVCENIEELSQRDRGFYDIAETNIHVKTEMGMVTVRSLSDAIHFSIVCILSMSVGSHYGLQAASSMGQVTAICLMAFGMLFMAMPIAIVGSVFSQTWFDQDRIVLLEKVRSRMKAQGYRWDDVEEVFDEVDKDRSGSIDLHEFKKLLKSFHIESLTRAKIQRLYRYFDLDGDGEINFHDFAGTLFPEMDHDDQDDEDESESDSDTDSDTRPSASLGQRNSCGSHASRKSRGEETLAGKITQLGKAAVTGMVTSLAPHSRMGTAPNSRRGSLHDKNQPTKVESYKDRGSQDSTNTGTVQRHASIKSEVSEKSDDSLTGEKLDFVTRHQSIKSLKSNQTGRYQSERGSVVSMKEDPLDSLPLQEVNRGSFDSEAEHHKAPLNETWMAHFEAILSRMDANITRLAKMQEKKNIDDSHHQPVMGFFGPMKPSATPSRSRRPSIGGTMPKQATRSRRPSVLNIAGNGNSNFRECSNVRRPSVTGAAFSLAGAGKDALAAAAAANSNNPSGLAPGPFPVFTHTRSGGAGTRSWAGAALA